MLLGLRLECHEDIQSAQEGAGGRYWLLEDLSSADWPRTRSRRLDGSTVKCRQPQGEVLLFHRVSVRNKNAHECS